jgi:hypothetical protein
LFNQKEGWRLYLLTRLVFRPNVIDTFLESFITRNVNQTAQPKVTLRAEYSFNSVEEDWITKPKSLVQLRTRDHYRDRLCVMYSPDAIVQEKGVQKVVVLHEAIAFEEGFPN